MRSIRRVCPAGQNQHSAVLGQPHVISTRRKDSTVTFEAKRHINRNPVGSKGGRCAKGGCENKHPHNWMRTRSRERARYPPNPANDRI
jgi:hypothetical protein